MRTLRISLFVSCLAASARGHLQRIRGTEDRAEPLYATFGSVAGVRSTPSYPYYPESRYPYFGGSHPVETVYEPEPIEREPPKVKPKPPSPSDKGGSTSSTVVVSSTVFNPTPLYVDNGYVSPLSVMQGVPAGDSTLVVVDQQGSFAQPVAQPVSVSLGTVQNYGGFVTNGVVANAGFATNGVVANAGFATNGVVANAGFVTNGVVANAGSVNGYASQNVNFVNGYPPTNVVNQGINTGPTVYVNNGGGFQQNSFFAPANQVFQDVTVNQGDRVSQSASVGDGSSIQQNARFKRSEEVSQQAVVNLNDAASSDAQTERDSNVLQDGSVNPEGTVPGDAEVPAPESLEHSSRTEQDPDVLQERQTGLDAPQPEDDDRQIAEPESETGDESVEKESSPEGDCGMNREFCSGMGDYGSYPSKDPRGDFFRCSACVPHFFFCSSGTIFETAYGKCV
ncbi:uncharacterized protein LOC100900955 [Galendromus occidentalis]|uniref:Uncharacterized protein LOC100900955 n=1 Tax=Galendromus occidentalis TaxID=34638 RepID=A0AAJ6QMZ0_9ACAR|nr:uncharacterized protein LOC100900955 [Galendromus occidentalis]